MSKMSVYLDFKQAVGLLRADLVWSPDMESIRLPLAAYLDNKANLGEGNNPELIKVVKALIAIENDITI